MSFDTTSVNTGRLNGACVLLKNITGRELLRLAWCHPFMELILAMVFTFEPLSYLNTPVFKSFTAAWEMWHMTNCKVWSQILKQKISVNPLSPASTMRLEGNGRRWRLCRLSNESSERIVRGRPNRLHEVASLIRDFATKSNFFRKSKATPVPEVDVSFLTLPPDVRMQTRRYNAL